MFTLPPPPYPDRIQWSHMGRHLGSGMMIVVIIMIIFVVAIGLSVQSIPSF